jgi:hypothetical protein
VTENFIEARITWRSAFRIAIAIFVVQVVAGVLALVVAIALGAGIVSSFKDDDTGGPTFPTQAPAQSCPPFCQ